MMDLSKGVPGARSHGTVAGRRALLQRAAIVAGILLIMLLGLLLTSGDEADTALPPDTAAPAPALAPLPKLNGQLPEPAGAAMPATPVPAGAGVMAENAPAGGGALAGSASPPAMPSASAPPVGAPTPPPAHVASPAKAPGGAEGKESKAVATPAVPPAASPAGVKAASADVSRPESASAAGAAAGGSRIQLGDFGRVDRAVGLARTLAAEGMPATVQRRVVVGPYAGREAASAAAERLSARVSVKGVVVPARRSGQFLVQTGVFSEARNAEALRARLAEAKFKVVVQGRVVLGPYASRAAAEKALAKVSGKRNIAGTIVSSER